MALTLVPRDDRAAPATAAIDSWFEAWRATVASSFDCLAALWALYDPRLLRGWLLTDLSRLSSEYLRSPSFLAMMRFTLK